MKLLVFSPYYPPHIGGLESHADEFNKYLSQTGVAITVFTPRLPEDALEFETSHTGVKIIRFPAFEIVNNYPLPKLWSVTFWKLFCNLFKEKFDIIISHTRFFNTSLLALIYAKTKRKHWIHIEHGSSFVQINSPFVSFFAKICDLTLGKIILNSADQIIAISQSVQTFVHELAPNAPCQVIYRGFDIEKIEKIEPNFSLKEKYKNDTIIIFIGRLISGKGVADLLQAFGEIQKPNLKCFIIGDGPERSNLEKLSKELQIEKDVVFFGNTPWDKTISILKIADIFVNPSYSEGLPTTVIEAALCQKAIIATNVGGTEEIISDNYSGCLIAAKDKANLSEKISHLISNISQTKTFGENAKKDAAEKFQWGITVKNFLTILK